MTNPYNRTAGGNAFGSNQNQNLRQPPTNPYATSNGGSGDGGLTSSNASSRPMDSVQRQHPHRGGRVRADRRFTTALEIFSGGTEDDADGPDRSAGPPPASMMSSASVQANHDRVRKLLEDDSDDDDDDILRPIW